MARILYPEISYEIVKALFAVHNELGPGYQEKYYQRAVAAELRKLGLSYKQEFSVPVTYDGVLIGRYFVDFLVDDRVIVEVKVVDGWKPIYFRQVLSYLRAANKPLAILANFGRARLQCRRLVNFQASKT